MYVIDRTWQRVIGHAYVASPAVTAAGPAAEAVYRTLRADGMSSFDAERTALVI